MVKASAVIYPDLGDPNKVLTIGSTNLGDPKPNELLLQALAVPLNPSDVLTVRGLYGLIPPKTTVYSNTPSRTVGFEGLFKVVKLGSEVEKQGKFKAGDWVIPKAMGTWCTHLLLDSKLVTLFPSPNGRNPSSLIDPATACTLFANPITAYHLLTLFTKLKPGDWVIQNGSNSAVGRAVFQFAKAWGIKTINVIRGGSTESQIARFDKLKQELLGLGATVVVSDKQVESPNFRKDLKSLTAPFLTNQKSPFPNIVLALDCVCGKNGSALLDVISKNGTFVSYGNLSESDLTVTTGHTIFKNIKVFGYWLTAELAKNPKASQDAFKDIVAMVAKGEFKPTPIEKHVWRIGDSEEKNLESVKNAFTLQEKGFANKKQVLVYETLKSKL